MRCPRCLHDNPPALKFCGEGGNRLAIICPAGGPAQKFCGECGAPLCATRLGGGRGEE